MCLAQVIKHNFFDWGRFLLQKCPKKNRSQWDISNQKKEEKMIKLLKNLGKKEWLQNNPNRQSYCSFDDCEDFTEDKKDEI